MAITSHSCEKHAHTNIGILKVAYRIAADLLDKAAGYLNELFSFGIRDEQVYMTSVWYKNGDKTKPLLKRASEIMERNPYVRGTYDLSRDWLNADLDAHLRSVRHSLTHRYLPIHLGEKPGGAPVAGALSAEQISSNTLLVLRTARASILHVIGATEMEIAHRLRAGE